MYVLQQLEDKLALIQPTNPKIKPIYVDFLSAELQFRCKKSNLAKEALVKAIGYKNSKTPISVVDATAGLGTDAFILAVLGCKVLLIERSATIAALLKDGMQRASASSTAAAAVLANMQLLIGDAIEILAATPALQYPDVICLDPMFPLKQKTALAKKEMLALRSIVGEDQDADALLVAALKIAQKRVVVKRPRLAPALVVTPAPSFSLTGVANRFDVYICNK